MRSSSDCDRNTLGKGDVLSSVSSKDHSAPLPLKSVALQHFLKHPPVSPPICSGWYRCGGLSGIPVEPLVPSENFLELKC